MWSVFSARHEPPQDLRASAAPASSHHVPANRATELVFPHCSKVFAAQHRADSARPLLHNEPAVLRLSQMPQLRGDARRRVMRQFREFVQRQPRFALPRAQHYVAQHVALPPPRDPFECPSPSFPHLRLLSRRVLVLGRKLFFAFAPCIRAFFIFSIVRRPRRTVRVFVIPRAGAASAHLIRPAIAIYGVNCALRFVPISRLELLPPKFCTVFHRITLQVPWTSITVLLLLKCFLPGGPRA